jgi:hypothetical protein
MLLIGEKPLNSVRIPKMFVEMSCQCGATLQLDGVNDTFTLLMANRFANSHTGCGYVTSVADDSEKTTRREAPKPKALKEDDED